ncbi:MAG: glycine cleavage system protein GcvH [Candidatus Latescibacteria bacterium]|jgi:glycine cleavage system H protein|nr:glycine cleavage system protein GcvH [Candidatus Latescibacterota bacterium]
MADIPEDLLYNIDHDWVRVEDDIGTCGITDYAQGELGDIVFLELPEAGDLVAQGEPYGTIEAVKTVSDLISPVSGEIVEINTQLTEDASLVNSEPYNEGWMIRVRLSDAGEMDDLMDASAYAGTLDE